MVFVTRSRAGMLAALAMLLGVLFALSTAAPVHAGGTVTNCANDSDFSGKLAGGGGVTFSCAASTIPFGSTKTIAANTTIDGGNIITLSGSGASRLFVVNNGVTLTLKNISLVSGYNLGGVGGAAVANSGHLVLDNVTVSYMIDSAFNGGGIGTTGAVEITNSTFHDNKATNGGAVYANGAGAVVTITNSTFYDNTATGTSANTNGFGGAIYGKGGATINVSGSTFHDNDAASGGAIYMGEAISHLNIQTSRIEKNSATVKGSGMLNDATTTLTDVTIDGNTGTGVSLGGGIYNYGNLTLTNVTVSNNAAYYGAGMSNAFSTANVTNVTFSGNKALAYGGGIDNLAATLYLTNVTLNRNTAGGGSAINNQNLANTNLYLKNVLVGSKTGSNCLFSKAPLLSDHNLSSDASCSFAAGGGGDSVKVKLGPLETNGGWTLTHRLLPGSAAIDTGVFVGTILTDQRAVTRPRGAAFEVGSVEFVPCAGTPTKAELLSPVPDAQLTTQQVLLDWVGPDCVAKFSVTVRQDSKSGTVVFSKSNLKPTKVTTTTLAKQHNYFWQVKGCLGASCSTSSWYKFKVN